MGRTDLYIRDKSSGRIHRIGDDRHDMIMVSSDGKLVYQNLQCGEGAILGDREHENLFGFEFVPNEDDHGFNCDPRREGR